jgi:hypothetical protein
MNLIKSQIQEQTVKLKMEIKFQILFNFIGEMVRFSNQRTVLIASHENNSQDLLKFLNVMINQYQKKSLEYEIVNYVDFEFIGSSSLIDAFIDLARIHENDNQSPIASTTSKMVYDFYLTILNALNEGHAFLKLSYDLRKELSGGTFCIVVEQD